MAQQDLGTVRPNKALITLAALGALALVVLTGFFAWTRLRPLRVAAYDLEAADAAALKAILADRAVVGRPGARLETLDPSQELGPLLAGRDRPDIVIGYAGAAMSANASLFAALPQGLEGRLPPPLRLAASTEGRAFAIALQADHFEFAYRAESLAAARLEAPADLAALEAAARRLASREDWPVFVAGGEDGSLLLLVTALVETEGGASASRALARALGAAPSLREALDAPLPGAAGDTSLREMLDGLVAWRERGLLHPEWYRMTHTDLAAFMERGMAPFVLMPLSLHRALPTRVVRQYESAAFPSGRSGASRSLAAPLLAAAAVELSPRRARALELLAALLGPEAQKRLCDATGLAPAAASAEALDRQASDARLWLAASRGALPDAGRASKPTGAARSALAREIRQYLEAGGAGF